MGFCFEMRLGFPVAFGFTIPTLKMLVLDLANVYNCNEPQTPDISYCD